MPRTHWKRPKKAGRLFLADGKRDAQGTLEYCKECPVRKCCKNVQYKARNVMEFYCVDNPKEKRSTIHQYDFKRGEIVANFINVRYVGEEPKMEACNIVEEER